MRVIKSISLPVHLAEKIESIPNVSAYIASMIADEERHVLALKCQAYRTQIANLEKTLRDICNANQRVTRKEYIRHVINMIDERHPLIWLGENDEN
jgi:hypothetical protein